MVNFYKPQVKDSIKNKVVELKVTGFNHDGVGVAKLDNKVCFVAGALPDEVVKARIAQDRSKFCEAETVKVVTANPLRRLEPCEHAKECGGCQLQHIDNDSQVNLKEIAFVSMLKRISGISVKQCEPAISDSEFGYRRSARVGVWRNKKNKTVNIGFRKHQKKEILNVNHCPVLDKGFENVFTAFSETITPLACADVITHLQLFAADNGLFVIVRHVKPLTEDDVTALQTMADKYTWCLISEPETNCYQTLTGEGLTDEYAMRYKLEGSNSMVAPENKQDISIEFRASDFIQVNRQINQQMVTQAIDWLNISSSDKVLDLFCGLGNFSLPLAKRAASVTGVEGVEQMVEQATYNAHANGLNNCFFYQADLDTITFEEEWAQAAYTILLLDPARAGAFNLVKNIHHFNVEKLLYVSCSPTAFARDAKVLNETGYELSKVGIVNMFPQTSHLESMALFVRKTNSGKEKRANKTLGNKKSLKRRIKLK